MQRKGSVPIPCVNVNSTIDTMLKFDANSDANVYIDAKCERTLTPSADSPMKITFSLNIQHGQL